METVKVLKSVYNLKLKLALKFSGIKNIEVVDKFKEPLLDGKTKILEGYGIIWTK